MVVLLNVLGIILLSFLLFNVVLYFVEPSLIAITFSFVLRIFKRNPPFVNIDEFFPKHTLLKENWQVIQEELIELLKNQNQIPKFHEIDKIQRHIADRDDAAWRVYMFKAYDNWQQENCDKAPKLRPF